MKYYVYELMERTGEYEYYHGSEVIALQDNEDKDKAAHKIAMENRCSDLDDYDSYMEAYWYGDGVTFVPTLHEIDKDTFNRARECSEFLRSL